MFTGTLTASTKSPKSGETAFKGSVHSGKFDVPFELIKQDKRSERAPDFAITAVNKFGRMIQIGSAWAQTSAKTGNRFLSMQMDVGSGPFRVNAVQTKEAISAKSKNFDIIPLVGNGIVKSASIAGELTKMDADDAYAGYIANMMMDLQFIMVRNDYKTETNHPDFRIEVSSPKGVPIRVGSAWMQTSEKTGNAYISLLINTADGDLRVNAVQNEEQRGGNTFSIIPFVDATDNGQPASGISLVA